MILNTSDTNSKCKHEFVLTEYTSQPIGTCVNCNSTVIKGNNKWQKL